MVNSAHADLLASLERWLQSDSAVQAAVLFGSRVREQKNPAAADRWSDIDLHVITSAADRLEKMDWAQALPDQRLFLQAVRPASGGVRKVTLLLGNGEADLVVVPSVKLRLAALAMTLGLHRRVGFIGAALNNLSTIMGGGYRFLKGEKTWGRFYARVVSEMPGFRLNDDEVRRLADVALCDLLWVLQKLERGEWVAAQRILHRCALETNVVLLHELRMRRGEATFQQARRVEKLMPTEQLASLQISARLDPKELNVATWKILSGLKAVMAQMVPEWAVPSGVEALLAAFTPAR